MDEKFNVMTYDEERRTYIKGLLYGKYYGWLDETDGRSHTLEKYYDIEVFEATVTLTDRKKQIRKWSEGEDSDFEKVELFRGKLPPEIILEIQEDDKLFSRFKIQLHDPKIKDITLGSPNYDGELVYGEFRGEISGYIKHFDKVHVAVERGVGRGGIIISEVIEATETPIIVKPGVAPSGCMFPSLSGCLSVFGFIFSGLFWLIAAVFLVSFFLNFSWSDLWNLLTFIGVVLLIGFFYLIFSYILRLIFALFALVFPFLVILGIVWLMDYIPTIDDQLNPKDSPEEVKSTEPLSENPQDSIISHYRIWKDYSGNTYKGRFKVKKSDYQQAGIDRNNLDYVSMSIKGYNALITELYSQQDSQLYMLYAMYDSIRVAAKLDSIKFAEMVVSSIQDIPYVLVLDGPCDRSVYQGEFVEQYLEKGGACKGNIKFGIYAPSEFLGHLNGDCDTRTVMLFTILAHFNYDVVILSSDRFGHSILGINLPMEGVSKKIDGKSYLMWETTSRGNPPGVVPRQFANGRYWDVNIKSTNYLK